MIRSGRLGQTCQAIRNAPLYILIFDLSKISAIASCPPAIRNLQDSLRRNKAIVLRERSFLVLCSNDIAGWSIEMGKMESSSSISTRQILILVLIFLLAPHTLSIEFRSLVDNHQTSIILVATVWTISYSYGSYLSGPFSSLSLLMPTIVHTIWSAMAMTLGVFLLWMVSCRAWGKGKTIRGVLLGTLIIPLFYLVAFSYRLDGWAGMDAFPLPVLQILTYFVAHRWHARSDYRSSSGSEEP